MSDTVSRPRISTVSEIITKREQLDLPFGEKSPFPLAHLRSEGAREIFALDRERQLIITTDRQYAFGQEMAQGIPLKGRVSVALSNLVFSLTSGIVQNHVVRTDMSDAFDGAGKYLHLLNGRSVVVTKTEPMPFDCVVRGYIYGSSWKGYKYKNYDGTVWGVQLSPGLQNGSKLEVPIFTPVIKNRAGFDEDVPLADIRYNLPRGTAGQIRETSIALYKNMAQFAEKSGLILADARFRFGLVDGKLMLIDTGIASDSSQLWCAKNYKVGEDQKSLNDMQFLNAWLRGSCRWTEDAQKQGVAAPLLPPEMIATAAGKYVQAYNMFTGKDPRTVAIIMGSTSDSKVAIEAATVLEKLGVWFGIKVLSAHRKPRGLRSLLAEIEADPYVSLYITVAGLAAHLSGSVAAWTVKPVIGVPAKGELSVLDGLDAVMSMIQMAPGVPLGAVGPVNNGKNAGIYAAQLLAMNDPELRARLRETIRKEE